jgi:hypothetical protein
VKLIASMMVGPGEEGRYLWPCIEHLCKFCDLVVVRTEPGQWEIQRTAPGDHCQLVAFKGTVPFYEHEGRARQELLDFTLQQEPTHILAIDSDEFIEDGQAVRRACEEEHRLWHLCLQEVWNANIHRIETRQDGGWQEHDNACLWRVTESAHTFRFPDQALACGRVPPGVLQASTAAQGHTCTGLLHFGWTNRSERAARHERYAIHDGGRYHQSFHLRSILWDDDRTILHNRPWPKTWSDEMREQITSHTGVTQ